MKVLKFGGSSVGSADSIQSVARIISDYVGQGQKIAVIASAMQGVTNMLIETGKRAAQADESYRDIIQQIEKKHFDAIQQLLKVKNQSPVLAEIKRKINELDDLMHGVCLLKELSPRTMDLLLSFGERMSCYVITQYVRQEGIAAEFLDTRRLIVTDSRFGNARVLTDITYPNLQRYFQEHDQVQIVTGFISSTQDGVTTTLGRGGSDYTAALLGAALDAKEIEM